MTTPCKYADIGKRAQDLFTKLGIPGMVKFNLKSGSSFVIDGNSEIESGKMSGNVEFKSTFPGTNMNMSNKWSADNNNLTSEINLGDKFFPGTKFSLLTRFDPKGGNIAGGLRAEYQNEFMMGMVDLAMTGEGKPNISPSVVFTSDGWLAGMTCFLDPSNNSVSKAQFTGGYETSSWSAFFLLTDNNQLRASLYQKNSDNMETTMFVQFPYGNSKGTTVQYAMNYDLDGIHRLRARVNTAGQVTAAICKNFGSGINISLCGMLDGKNLKGGAHKIGVGIEMEM